MLGDVEDLRRLAGALPAPLLLRTLHLLSDEAANQRLQGGAQALDQVVHAAATRALRSPYTMGIAARVTHALPTTCPQKKSRPDGPNAIRRNRYESSISPTTFEATTASSQPRSCSGV